MPRKKRTKKKANAETNTYYNAKNGRFYKKIQIDGKTRVRFVTNAEATGSMTAAKPKPKRTRKKKQPQSSPPKEAAAGAQSPDDEKSE